MTPGPAAPGPIAPGPVAPGLAALPPVDDGLVIREDGQVVLMGGRCAQCGGAHFPLQPCCPYCGAVVDRTPMPTRGTVHAVTTTTLPVPGTPGPGAAVLGTSGTTTIALVELLADVMVQGVVEHSVQIGDAVRVVGRELVRPDGPALGFAFRAGPDDA